MEPVRHAVDLDGEEFCVFEWGDADLPVLFLSHATGFHGRCWDAVIRHLNGAFRVLAVDLRGHGRSTKEGSFTWDQFATDLEGLLDHFGVKRAIAVGHSMGGHALVQIAARRADQFSSMLLLDPVIFSSERYDRPTEFMDPAEHPVARRRARFASWEEMYEHFKDRPPFSLWVDEVLEDYCRYGVLPHADGGVTLACPPVKECSVYVHHYSVDAGRLATQVQTPTVIWRAQGPDPDAEQMDFSRSPTWPELASQFPNAVDREFPELTHFIPMQVPEQVAACILDLHDKQGDRS